MRLGNVLEMNWVSGEVEGVVLARVVREDDI